MWDVKVAIISIRTANVIHAVNIAKGGLQNAIQQQESVQTGVKMGGLEINAIQLVMISTVLFVTILQTLAINVERAFMVNSVLKIVYKTV